MKWLPFTILTIILLIAQLTTLNLFSLGGRGVVPDFLVILAMLIALRASDVSDALLQAWLIGMLHDLSSTAPFGIYAMTISLAAWLISIFRNKFYFQNLGIVILSTFVLSFLIEMIVLLALIMRGELLVYHVIPMLVTIGLCAVYNAAIIPWFVPLVKPSRWHFS